MNPPVAPRATPEQLELLIQLAHSRYMVALLLLWGLVLVALGTLAMACGLRKTGFLLLGGYGVLMSAIGVGLCYIFGPLVLMAAVAGLAVEWIRGSRRASS